VSRMLELMVGAEDLKDLPRELQLDAMRHWFFEHYEDPAERTPYESREGGYIWIYGGPHDAREVLQEEFADVVPSDVIEELVDELEGECYEWAPREQPGDYEDFYLEEFRTVDHHSSFIEGISQIEALMKSGYDKAVEDMYLRMLYAAVVTLMETYLGGAFVSALKGNAKALRRYVESTPEYKKESLPLATIFEAMDGLEQRVLRHLADVLWHNLAKVRLMYKDCFAVEFPECAGIFAAILKRHDIVHRNGKDKDGNSVDIEVEDLKTLISDVKDLVEAVQAGMAEFEPPF
jgi:hypothetical protein